MKKIIFFVFVLSILASVGFSQYYDNNNEHNDYYYNTDYEEDNLTYEYGYEDALPYLQNYNGRIYYWVHPYENLYFVIIGRRVFIIPGDHINRIGNSMRWLLVTMDRFIALTCFGLPYYDNYVRFHYYYDYYNRHRYNRYNNHRIRDNYKMYYKNRHRNNVKKRSVYNKPTPKRSFQYSRENIYKRSPSKFKNHNFKSPRSNYQDNNPKRSGSYQRKNSYKKSQSRYGKQSSYPQKKRNFRHNNRRN